MLWDVAVCLPEAHESRVGFTDRNLLDSLACLNPLPDADRGADLSSMHQCQQLLTILHCNSLALQTVLRFNIACVLAVECK